MIDLITAIAFTNAAMRHFRIGPRSVVSDWV